MGTEVDHILPKAEGGTDDDTNLQTICKARHRIKTQAEAARARGLTPAPMTQPRPAQGLPCAILATRPKSQDRSSRGNRSNCWLRTNRYPSSSCPTRARPKQKSKTTTCRAWRCRWFWSH
jgi:hypothetical protein